MKTRRLLLGMLVGNAAGALISGVVFLFFRDRQTTAQPNAIWAAAYPSLILVPLVIGWVAMRIWRPLGLKLGAVAAHCVTCCFVSLFGAFLVFQEGVVCLIIASPILYIGTLCGAILGRFGGGPRDRVQLSIAPLLVIAVVIEPALRGSHGGVVVDEIRIAAPPARVWPHVLAFNTIPSSPSYWLFKLGLPYPTATTNAGNFVGAARACQFSGGAVFEETIVELQTARLLTFDIIKSPPDPELLGHLDAERGQFELRENSDGTTTLIGRTWYTLHVRPAWYFDYWTHDIFRAVHLRVMNQVRNLAEHGR